MEEFAVLRIEPTTDEKIIKRAYTQLLKIYNPETHPEEFQHIREAYEKAMNAAKAGILTGGEPETPLEQYVHRLKQVYDRYESRLDVEAWQALLELDVCHLIDTREAASRETLTFLTEYFHIPHRIWVVLNTHFEWSKQKEKLLEDYHQNFIEFVMNRIERDQFFRYEELLSCEPGQQEMFIKHYRTGMQAIDDYDYYTAHESLLQLAKLCPSHPDAIILGTRYSMALGRLAEAGQKLNELLDRDEADYYARYYRAGLLFRLGRYEEAYQDYKRVLPIRPDAADVLFSLGKCAVSLGYYADASAYLNQLKQILPNDHEVINLMASAHRFQIDEMTGGASGRPDDVDAAHELVTSYLATGRVEEAYQLLCELEPHHPSAKLQVQLCVALHTMQKKELALTKLNEALALYPDHMDLHHWKAVLLEELGELESAVVCYDKAIELKPDEASLYNNKAYTLNLLGRHEEALASADLAIRYDASFANSYRQKADALLSLGRYGECFEAADKALSINSYYTEAYVVKMRMLNRVGQYRHTIDVFQQAVRHDLRDVSLYVEKANALRNMGEFEEALANCDYALDLEADQRDALLCKGMCYFRMQQYDDAVAEFEKLNAQQRMEQAVYYAALSYYNMRQLDEAYRLANEEIGQAEQADLFYDLIGDIHRDNGDRSEAIEAYRNAIAIDPAVASYHLQLGILLHQDETWQESLHHLDQAIVIDPMLTRAYEKRIHVTYDHAQDYEQCITLCHELLAVDSESAYAYDFLAWAHYMLERKEEAAAYIQQGLALDSQFVSILHLRMTMLIENGQTREALAVCDRILELEPDHEDTLAQRARLLHEEPKKSVFSWLGRK
ncbi:tetratricopeptide repeat protein [Paenibacillus sp. 1011MAR3C5]|uniref:J domain-containing protein n=1 Tax=Paenibacillus sp. 1011MAR3C5 TaxID=1675787 RepID=UPI000E6C4E46|nr:tetratricopeptide repeat protein [Paenibacillus sp. 1011MAR3C5]RJE86206.1 tetratricopeptide repeat protein [Paenibacillus sp. 1011MAR3C5]